MVKKCLILGLLLVAFSNVFSQKIVLNTEMDSVSYALGANITTSFLKQGIKGLEGDKIKKGFKDFLESKSIINSSESIKILQNFMMEHQSLSENSSSEVSYRKSLTDSVSYALGVNISETFKEQDIHVDINLLSIAFNDVYLEKALINEEEALNILQIFGQKQQAIAAEKAKLEFADQIEEGKSFLAKNAKRSEITTLPSGLQYEVIKEGRGEIPTAMSTVTTHYHGTLIDGTIFDSSVDRGEPIDFGVTQVIKGWTEALQLMPVGSKWKLYIPYDLAYGERGSGAKIGPYSTLIFDVELLNIVK